MAEDQNNQEEQHEGEVLQDSLSKTEVLLEKNKNLISKVLLAVVIVITGVLFYQRQVSEPAELDGLNNLYLAQDAFAKDSLEKSLIAFEDVASENSGSVAGNLANLYVAVQLIEKKQFDEALESLESFDAKGMFLPHMKKGLMGDCYSELNEWETAVDYYKDAAKGANSSVASPYFYKKAGILLEQNGQASEAIALYQLALDKHLPVALPDYGTQRKEMQKLLERAKAAN